MLAIVTGISIYSSQKKIKFFVSIFLTSILGGHALALLVLILFSKISITTDFTPELLVITLTNLTKFSAIPSISISAGLLTPPKRELGEGLSN